MQMIRYSKAPITEALIDIKVTMPLEVNLSNLQGIRHLLETDYPICEAIIIAQGEFQAGPSVTATATQTTIGYSFSSNDKRQVFQARLDGFTFSHLAPYDTWKSLRDEAKRLWILYLSVTQARSIKRIAVRYINRLDIPLDPSHPLELKDYLRTVPEVSPDLPQSLSGYFMQIQIPQTDLGAFLVLNEATLPSELDEIASVLLDIDLFAPVDLPVDGERQWDLLEDFRLRKNKIFEACITDKTRELIK